MIRKAKVVLGCRVGWGRVDLGADSGAVIDGVTRSLRVVMVTVVVPSERVAVRLVTNANAISTR